MTHPSDALLSAHVDGEAPEGVAAHVASCVQCRARVEALAGVAGWVAETLDAEHEVPPSLLAAVTAEPAAPRSGSGWRGAAAAAALLSLVGALVLALGDGARTPSLREEVVADHRRLGAGAPEVFASGADASEVLARHFAPHLGVAPVVGGLPGAELVGGRRCTFGDTPAALLTYRRAAETLSLFVFDGVDEAEGCARYGEESVCARRAGALTLMLVGPEPPAELGPLLASATVARGAQ
ncbi:MAG: hypothetical protein AAGH15_02580 [Myxococcota bacterium]